MPICPYVYCYMDPILDQDFLNLQITAALREKLVILSLFEVITIKVPGGGGGGGGCPSFTNEGGSGPLSLLWIHSCGYILLITRSVPMDPKYSNKGTVLSLLNLILFKVLYWT